MPTEPIVTICIPYATYHREHVPRAVDSAYRQTLPCLVQIKEDIYGYGAGATRNAILASVKTPFIVWLDADDTLSPTFVETCLRAWKPGTYVYTDWQEDDVAQTAPLCDEWIDGGGRGKRIHLVTTLLLTAAARKVRGFDHLLPGAEDTDFYLKLRAFGFCPVRVPQALVHYSGDGQRSEVFKRHPDRMPILQTMFSAYKDKIMSCGCEATASSTPQGGKQDGDVIAEALYTPAKEFGLGGRFYPRPTHTGARMWVARADVAQWPGKWRMVDDPDNIAPDVDKVIALALAGLEAEMV